MTAVAASPPPEAREAREEAQPSAGIDMFRLVALRDRLASALDG